MDEPLIYVSDGNNSLRVIPLSQLRDEICEYFELDKRNENNIWKETSHYKKDFTIKNFDCRIRYNGWAYCGYIKKIPFEIASLLNIDDDEPVSTIPNIYEPHGGWSDSSGFDCAHHDDYVFYDYFSYSFSNINKNNKSTPSQTFKSQKYVTLELEKIIDSIIKTAHS